jgi:hypothetical protein
LDTNVTGSAKIYRSRIQQERSADRQARKALRKQHMAHEAQLCKELLPQLIVAREALQAQLDQNEWKEAKEINLKRGRKFRAAVQLGVVASDGETYAPLCAWFAIDGKYYIYDSWSRYREIKLQSEPSWMLKSLLKVTREHISYLKQ